MPFDAGTGTAAPAHAPVPLAVRVLLVEDDSAHAMLATRRLARSPLGQFTVDIVSTGEAALEAVGAPSTTPPAALEGAADVPGRTATQTRYDAVLIDYQLRDTDGLTLLARLRAAGLTAPAMLLTSHGSEEVAAAALRADANDYLSKQRAFIDGDLDRAVLAMVERRRLADRLARAEREAARLEGALLVARTVAHEINNAVAPIVGYADLLAGRPELAGNPITARYVSEMAAAGAAVVQRVQQLNRLFRLEEDASLGLEWTVLHLGRSAAPAGADAPPDRADVQAE